MIINQIEMMETLIKQKGIISDTTLLENHPLVDDIEMELERIEEQNEANPVVIPVGE
jgi:hypothetical protein